jgi:hypothetical protein
MSAEPAGCFCGKVRMTVTGEADGHVSSVIQSPKILSLK